MIEECKKCGAKFELTDHKTAYGLRDKDSIECSYCGEELTRWNGAFYYSSKEVSAPTKEYKKT